MPIELSFCLQIENILDLKSKLNLTPNTFSFSTGKTFKVFFQKGVSPRIIFVFILLPNKHSKSQMPKLFYFFREYVCGGGGLSLQ